MIIDYEEVSDSTVKIVAECDMDGEISSMILPISLDQFTTCMYNWHNGMLIQDAFPMLEADEREFIKTGIHPQKWHEVFGSLDDLENEDEDDF